MTALTRYKMKKSAWAICVCFLVFWFGTTTHGQPTNDNFEDRTQLSGNAITFSGTTMGATPDEGLFLFYPTDPTIWWSWTATKTSTVIIERLVPSIGRWGQLAVCTGTNYSEPGWATVAEGFLDTRGAVTLFQAQAGQEYQIVAATSANEPYELTFRLTATEAPLFTTQPTNATVPLNAPARFSALAIGASRPSYQWQFNGVDIPAATNLMLVFDSAAYADAGDYRVVATLSPGNTATSAVAHLEVTVDPIAVKAQGLTGTNFEFTTTGQVGRNYYLDFSTDLRDWPLAARRNVSNTNATTLFNVAADAPAKFVRLTPYNSQSELCWHIRQQIAAATRLWAEENRRRETDAPDSTGIEKYLIRKSFSFYYCPANGYYGLSSTIADDWPRCPNHWP